MFSTLPRIFDGRTAFVIGGGPSLKEMRGLDRLLGKCVIGCNDAYRLGAFVQVCFFGDMRWWTAKREDGIYHYAALSKFPGTVVTCFPQQLPHDERLVRLKRLSTGPLGTDSIRWYGNTGTTAVLLAAILGATKAVLLGFDMRLIDGESNWHVNLKNEPNANVYPKFLRQFDILKIDLERHYPAFQVVNATPGSALTVFPVSDFDKELVEAT